jgi:hypothetical protein
LSCYHEFDVSFGLNELVKPILVPRKNNQQQVHILEDVVLKSSKTISKEYLKQQQELHENPGYGVASLTFAPLVAKIINDNKIQSVSDYGAGKKRLLEGLKKAGLKNIEYFPYDPAFPEYGEPRSADLVCCIDVLEHVEPTYVESVIRDLAAVTTKFGFFSVHVGAAGKTLSDGRNAHLIQEPSSWWLPKFCNFFDIMHLQTHNYHGPGFWFIVKAKP